ncbi:hypothetical protein ACP70R_021763 [Stipagrostis hirtigluma subsp. patula]
MEPRIFKYEELNRMTDNFHDSRIIGEGTFGVVYLGEDDKGLIAVKKLHDDSPNAKADVRYQKEFDNLKMFDHPNIVKMLGYCKEIQLEKELYHGGWVNTTKVYRLFCFEYLPGCLKDKVEDGLPSGLNWSECYNIILGICLGLQHSHLELGMHHMDIKPGNILLDEHNNAKLADFGLATIFEQAGTKTTWSSYGTPRYWPPEYFPGRRRSPTFDIYSFGVLMLELVAGRKAYDNMRELLVEREAHGNIDSITPEEFSPEIVQEWKNKYKGSFLELHCEQLKTCIAIGLDCIKKDRKKRPGIQDIINRLTMTENVASASNVSPQNQGGLPTPTKSEVVGGSAGTDRDIEEKPRRLESLTIGYLGLIDAFSFSYIDQTGKKQTAGPWGEGYTHDNTETILFGPSEFLEEVLGTHGTHFENVLVMSLAFVTNVKIYGPFGNPYHQNVPATPFSFTADEDSSIVGFHGSSGAHLYSIGVYTFQCPSKSSSVRPLPAPGQSLPTPNKSGAVGGTAGIARDIEETPWRLERLTISYLGLVDAFSFSYTDQAGKRKTVGPWGEGYHHDKTKMIRFGPAEFLVEVSGTYGTHFDNVLVMSLMFVTNIRSYGPFGNPHHQNVPATPFRFRADENSSIVGFHGRSGQHLYSIGVYTTARPVSQQ